MNHKECILILGNQLFNPELLKNKIGKNVNKTIVFMREDVGLCTYVKHHQKKIYFFLKAMRDFALELENAGFNVHYEKLGADQLTYADSFSNFIDSYEIKSVSYFEIEDRFFEIEIAKLLKKKNISTIPWDSPMFVTPRGVFKEYLKKTKRPFMKVFYEEQRKRLNILMDKNGNPEGGKWSFDAENRKPLPKGMVPPKPSFQVEQMDEDLKKKILELFSDHPGDLESFWLPTNRKGAELWLKDFFKNRFNQFGDFEDALVSDSDFVYHSALTPFLNVGLLLSGEVIDQAILYAKKHQVPMNSLEGFVRQLLGWREFIRGIYQNFHQEQETSNFFSATKKLSPHWYRGDTGIEPLDDAIKKTLCLGYAHHIERLMVVGSLMLLLEIHPAEAHRWFMEMYIDSSDWVMGPNVYGMALFSDGGIFATKPYFCGSNYYRKMGRYSGKGWSDGVDGLYWSFIDKHRSYFSKNYRLAMSVKTFDKMPAEKKEKIFREAEKIRKKLTV